MLSQVAVFSVHRDHDLRVDQPMNLLEVRAVGVAGHVVKARAVIHHIHALFAELVDDEDYTTFVAGDGLGREQEQVALFQFDPAIFAPRQLRTGGAALTLAAGDDQHQVLARQFNGFFGADNLGKIGQDTGFGRRLDHPPHGTTQQHNGTPCPLAPPQREF